MYYQALTSILTEQKFISDCRYRIESSSLVPVLFRKVFSHPYISFFLFTSKWFSVTLIIIIFIINFFIRVFSEDTEAVTTSLIPIDAILPEIQSYIVGFSCTAWTKLRSSQAN